MRIVVFDIETELIPREGHRGVNTIWCIVTKELDKETKVWSDVKIHSNWVGTFDDFVSFVPDVDLWVAHNGLSFDVPVVNRVLGAGIEESKVVDTFVVSRLVNYSGFSTHSLAELGQYLGVPKTVFNDFSKLSLEMVNYCVQDVVVNERIYKMYERYIHDDAWKEAMRLEHDMVLINEDMSKNGFKFNKEKAEELLSSIKERMAKLEAKFQECWPPWLTEVNRVQFRIKQDGSFYSTTENAMERYPKTKLEGTELVCYDYETFNPGSTKHRIDKLWEAGWEPVVRTKTHQKFGRCKPGEMWGKTLMTPEAYQDKKEYFEYYGWKVDETNLQTVPDSAPEGAKLLAQWLTLEGRRSSLEEWLGCVQEDGRIHGKFWNIGAWTHRMSHSAPNQANVFSPFHGQVDNAVKEIKKEYDATLRSLWCVDEDKYLVGTDAEGIQLRILAHYMKDEEYAHAIHSGRKEDLTDIHNVNRKALALDHITRDDAKTFIYSWLLGSGTALMARNLRTTNKKAKEAEYNFLESLPKLKKLKTGLIPRDARRGYFEGLDGRKVVQNSEHLMLAGYLQNGEAIVMKHANRLWRKWADEEKILYKQVDFVHDEWQTECSGSLDMAERLGEIQRNSIVQAGLDLNIFCPLAGSTDIGKNWLETH